MELLSGAGRHYMLLERRSAGADGLTIETRLFELAGGRLGREAPLATLPATADLRPTLLLPGVPGVGLASLRTPMLNCVDGGAEAAVERVAIVLHDQYSGEDDVIYDAALDEFEALYGDISTGALRWIEDEGIEDEHDIDRAVWTVYGDGEAVSVPASRYNNEVWGALIPESGYILSSDGGSWRLAAQEGGAYLEVTAMGAAEYGEWYAASFGDGKSLPVNGGIYERNGFWELCRWFEQSGSGRGIVEYIYCPAAEPAAGETLLRVYRSITMA